jgi:tetratricopeptide (TPR) repeat protein
MSDAHREEIDKLEALYAENPEGRVFTHLAEAYRKAGDPERAREVLEQGIERHPDYSSAHVVLGRVLRDLDRGGEAEAEFRRVLELDNHNLIALRALGDLARERGDADTALSYYERLVEVEPSDEVREAMAELAGDTPEDGGDADPWSSVPAEHDRHVDPAGSEAEVGWDEETGPEEAGFTAETREDAAGEEPAWSTEVDVDGEPSAYGPWVGAGEDRESDDDAGEGSDGVGVGDDGEREGGMDAALAGADEAGDDEAEEIDAGSLEDLAYGAGPYASGAPEEDTTDEAYGDLQDASGVTTETIAQVYARQGLYDRAADVYRELLQTRPDDEALRDRLAEMEQLASAREERPADEEVAVYHDDDATDGTDAADAMEIEGFETEEFEPDHADAEPIPGLEVQDADPETGLIVEATPDQVVAEDQSGELGVTDVPEPPEESPWPTAGSGPEDPGDGVDPAMESVWTDGDWGEASEAETPYAWAGGDAQADESPAIRDYFGGLLSWTGSGGGGEASGAAGAGETGDADAPDHGGEPEVSTAPGESDEPLPPPEDDDDLDMFRSWLESLKQ